MTSHASKTGRPAGAGAASHQPDPISGHTAADRRAPVSLDVALRGPHAALWTALREVRDPELPISLVDLGLVYAIRREGSRVHIDLTFTATACPCMEFIREDIRTRLFEEPGIEHIEIHEVWDPPWTTDRLTPEGRAALRKGGVGVSNS
jgi:metal-sulfur cluster biosynthetic enzyme